MNSTEILSERELYLYAFLSYVFENESIAISDILTPIVKSALSRIQQTEFTVTELQKILISDFGKEFPKIIIQRDLFKISKEGYIENINSNNWKILRRSSEYDSAHTESRNAINNFFIEFNIFLTESQIKYVKYSTIVKKFNEYCNQYLVELAPFLSFNGITIEISSDIDKFHDLISSFLNTKVRNNPSLLASFSTTVP